MYKFSTKATLDLKAIVNYTTAQFGILQSDQYLANLKETLEKLSQFPRMGRTRDEIQRGLFSYIYRSHTIYYSLLGDDILIVRILHQRMDHKRLM